MVDHMFRSGTERRHKMEELEDRIRAARNTGMEDHPEFEEVEFTPLQKWICAVWSKLRRMT